MISDGPEALPPVMQVGMPVSALALGRSTGRRSAVRQYETGMRPKRPHHGLTAPAPRAKLLVQPLSTMRHIQVGGVLSGVSYTVSSLSPPTGSDGGV